MKKVFIFLVFLIVVGICVLSMTKRGSNEYYYNTRDYNTATKWYIPSSWEDYQKAYNVKDDRYIAHPYDNRTKPWIPYIGYTYEQNISYP